MNCSLRWRFSSFLLLGLVMLSMPLPASSTMSKDKLKDINKTDINSPELRQKIEKSAVLLANYEIAAKKLVRMAETGKSSAQINSQANQLMDLSEVVINSARFRLPQCDEYLAKSLNLRSSLAIISQEALEKDYHHDGALPEAPAECYHAKDLFIHPATVVVLTRDDPELQVETINSIKAEILEVLAHTEFVRQLVMY